MRIKMLRSENGAANPSGSATKLYREGEIHEMEADWQLELAMVFVREGWAEDIGVLKAEAPEAKDAGPAPENKAIESADEDKGRDLGPDANQDDGQPTFKEGEKGWYKLTWPGGATENVRRARLVELGLVSEAA